MHESKSFLETSSKETSRNNLILEKIDDVFSMCSHDSFHVLKIVFRFFFNRTLTLPTSSDV